MWELDLDILYVENSEIRSLKKLRKNSKVKRCLKISVKLLNMISSCVRILKKSQKLKCDISITKCDDTKWNIFIDWYLKINTKKLI